MDTIRRSVIFVCFGAILAYLLYLFSTGVEIVLGNSVLNNIVYLVLAIIFLYYIVFYSIKPTYIKFYKVINVCIGLFILYISTIMANSGIDQIYYGDIISVIGVILTILGFTDLFISKDIKKKKEDSKAEIIEIN